MLTQCFYHTYVSNHLATAKRIDIIWDAYTKKVWWGRKDLKAFKDVCLPTTLLPQNWKDFDCASENKTSLFKFLAQHVARLSPNDGKVKEGN